MLNPIAKFKRSILHLNRSLHHCIPTLQFFKCLLLWNVYSTLYPKKLMYSDSWRYGHQPTFPFTSVWYSPLSVYIAFSCLLQNWRYAWWQHEYCTHEWFSSLEGVKESAHCQHENVSVIIDNKWTHFCDHPYHEYRGSNSQFYNQIASQQYDMGCPIKKC